MTDNSVLEAAEQILARRKGANLHAIPTRKMSTSACKTDAKRHCLALEQAAFQVSAKGRFITINDLEMALSDADTQDSELLQPEALLALANAVQASQMRQFGEIPAGWTAATICRHCGEVPIWPGCSPSVEGCPWCFNRIQGKPAPRINR